MKKMYEKPMINREEFVANEYVAFCGMTEDGTWLVGEGVIEERIAYNRFPDGVPGFNGDDRLEAPHYIYLGSFYRDGKLDSPDSTHLGHESQDVFDEVVTCVRYDGPGGDLSMSPWGYHYHFAKISNHS